MNKCKSCLYSVQFFSEGRFGLYCEKWSRDTETVSECENFVYEPGTDAEESEGNK